MRHRSLAAALGLGLAAALAGPAVAEPVVAEPVVSGDLVIERPQLRATSDAAPVAGGYLLITNRGTEDDALIGARAEVAGSVEVHEMSLDEGVMRMREVDVLVIPAGQSVSLQPGGYHLMLMRPQPLAEGEAHDLTLVFARAGEVTVGFDVVSLDAIRESLMPVDEIDQHEHDHEHGPADGRGAGG